MKHLKFAVSHQARFLSLPVTIPLCLSFVMLFLALGKTKLALRNTTTVEIDAHRHQGVTATAHLPHEAFLLAFVQEQLTRSARLFMPAC